MHNKSRTTLDNILQQGNVSPVHYGYRIAMKGLVILFVFVGAACAGPPDKSFDAINVSEYNAPAKVKALVNCITSKGPCTPLEAIMIGRAPNILITHCGDCTKHERDIIVILSNRIAEENKADIFKVLKLLDPAGKRSKEYLKYLNRVSEERGLPKLSDDIINALPDNKSDSDSDSYFESLWDEIIDFLSNLI